MNSTSPVTRLLAEITCPNCWHKFAPEKLLFVARHDRMLGDDVVGADAFRRFLPTRFSIEGHAVDPGGMPCHQLACPRCHLELPRPHIEMPGVFLSIIGAPASGKSHYLAAMTHLLRQQAANLDMTFLDADPAINTKLHSYEELLFFSPRPNAPVELPKTQQADASLIRTISLDGQVMSYPRPFQFVVGPKDPVKAQEKGYFPFRSVVLYDNAGESFLPGSDTSAQPLTLHLAEAQALLFLFDPTQDPRFRAICKSDDPQLKFGNRAGQAGTLSRQEVILNEAIARIRIYRGLAASQKHKALLVVVLPKADIWANLINLDLTLDPVDHQGFHTGWMMELSERCRQLLSRTCPEIVNTCESFSNEVIYVPVSSLGASPQLVEGPSGPFYGIKPSDIHPRWVTTPVLAALHKCVPGLVKITPQPQVTQPASL
jgi:hypothetical protein